MGSDILLESEILFEAFAASSGVFGALISAVSVYYFGITKRDKRGVNSFLSKLNLELPSLLISLINLDLQNKECEKALEGLKQAKVKFTPVEYNAFEYLKIEWNIPDYLFQHNEQLAHDIHAFSANLKIISQTTRKTCVQIKEIKTKLENNTINTTQAIDLYEKILHRNKMFATAIHETTAQGFMLWSIARKKSEDPQELYNKLRYGIIEKAKQMYYDD